MAHGAVGTIAWRSWTETVEYLFLPGGLGHTLYGVGHNLYDDQSGGGDCHNMNARSEDNNISVFDSDDLSSWRTNRGC